MMPSSLLCHNMMDGKFDAYKYNMQLALESKSRLGLTWELAKSKKEVPPSKAQENGSARSKDVLAISLTSVPDRYQKH